MIHARSQNSREWAACGAEGRDIVLVEDFAPDVDAHVTCIACMCGQWLADDLELHRIITRNSVKDMQDLEDEKAWRSIRETL